MSTSVLSLAFEPEVKAGIGLESMARPPPSSFLSLSPVLPIFNLLLQLCIMGRSGHARRIESAGPEFIKALPEVQQKITKAGWEHCIYSFKGHDVEVSSQFILSLQDGFSTVNGLRFKVTEATIAEATRTSMEGEKWFKNQPLHEGSIAGCLEQCCKGGADVLHLQREISGEVIWFPRFYDADREVGSIGNFLGKTFVLSSYDMDTCQLHVLVTSYKSGPKI
eukprot:Gb_15767 [translate_table: standard]